MAKKYLEKNAIQAQINEANIKVQTLQRTIEGIENELKNQGITNISSTIKTVENGIKTAKAELASGETKIVAAADDIEIEDLIKEEQTVIALTHFGYVKRMPVDTYKSQKRGGKGITGMATREEDFVKQIFTASTHDMILFFSNRGKVYTEPTARKII